MTLFKGSRGKRRLWIILGILFALMLVNDVFLGIGALTYPVPILLVPAVGLKIVAFFFTVFLLSAHQNLVTVHNHDDLTSAYTRRYLFDQLEEKIHSNRRSDSNISLMMIDIDHFKELNDEHGHYVGDSILVELSTVVNRTIRNDDIFARTGGEEFLLLLPDTTHEEAIKLAERLRVVIERMSRPGMSVTVSIGVVEWDGKESADSLYNRADEAMYEAKARGRNKVIAK